MVDDSHAVGFVGRDRPRHARADGVMDRVDIITGTLGKALGGASGGYTRGRARDRRAAAPALAAVPVLEHARAADRRPPRSKVLELLERGGELRERLRENTALLPRRG